ncbi:MAG: SAM-dependent methyltransferase [Parcubacteria group bacterium Greene0416_79]|nr:MAG: SAM-dependent methyltransferase [Parcubacteria group bacterium Greene0416_79]
MFADPTHIIEQFELQSGAHVADLGAGSGALAFAAARAVGEAGRVYAIEVQKELLERLKSHAREERLHNLEAIWGDIERAGGTHLKPETVDAVLVSNVLFQAEDREGLAKEAARILKPRGKALVVDWSESFGGMGPQPALVIAERAARELFLRHGFTFAKSITAGAHHYGLIFKRS